MKKRKLIFFICTVIIVFHSCVDDTITPPISGDLNPGAEMLVYFEEKGDFANSMEAPALINAEEVYQNSGSYLIIDIRRPTEYSLGHIEESVNVQISDLYAFFENLATSNYTKIILVSKNGQSSAYFTCLLRLAGYNNVYSMNFGLASWNEFFADEWLSVLGDDPLIFNYTNSAPPQNDFESLPEINFDNPNASIEVRVKTRIKNIIAEGFNEGIHYGRRLQFSAIDFLVCYGIAHLYYAPQNPGPGHNPAAHLYIADPAFELRAHRLLQTLPNNKKIFIYSENGQLSACIIAYLRVLGYNASTLLFGGNQLIYNRMLSTAELDPFVFDNSDIKNYPYNTGD